MFLRLAAFAPLLAAACAPLAELPSRADLTRASDPRLGLTPLPGGPAVAYAARPVTDPADWRALNAAQAPEGTE